MTRLAAKIATAANDVVRLIDADPNLRQIATWDGAMGSTDCSLTMLASLLDAVVANPDDTETLTLAEILASQVEHRLTGAIAAFSLPGVISAVDRDQMAGAANGMSAFVGAARDAQRRAR